MSIKVRLVEDTLIIKCGEHTLEYGVEENELHTTPENRLQLAEHFREVGLRPEHFLDGNEKDNTPSTAERMAIVGFGEVGMWKEEDEPSDDEPSDTETETPPTE